MANIPFLNNAYFSAKVGIGTDNPLGELHVKNVSELYTDLDGSDAAVNFLDNESDVWRIGIRASDNSFRFSQDATSLGSNVRLTIADGGNVGIGTDDPSRDGLNVFHTTGPYVHLTNTTTGDLSSDGGYLSMIGTELRLGNQEAGGILSIFTNNSTGNGITILSNGNVGIGTTSPSARLEVSDSNTTKTAIHIDNTSTGGNRWDIASIGSGVSGRVGNLQIRNDSDTLNIVEITAAGNVGIGNTSPSEKLDVAGNIKIQSALLSNQGNTDVSGLELVANVLIASYTAAFFDFVVKKGTNVRSGTVYACHDGTNVEFTETSTNDLGNTSDVVLSVDISGTNMRLLADAATSGWSVKSLIRAI